MRVEDRMTRDVVAVAPGATLKEVADLLIEHGISGVPVCSDGRVLGVVSESDILWKELRSLPDTDGVVVRLFERAYRDDRRRDALTAGQAMTSPPVTVQPEASVARAARLMIEHGVNRLPVVSSGRLVGILTRSDVVRAFRRSDEEIEREIRADVLRDALCVDPQSVSLAVAGGEVAIAGEVENRSTAGSIERRIRRVPGVASVRSDLRWQIDDRARRTAAAAVSLPRKV
jgi:CBS domain-containing protein